MLKDVMRAGDTVKDPAILFETAFDVATVGEHPVSPASTAAPTNYKNMGWATELLILKIGNLISDTGVVSICQTWSRQRLYVSPT